MRGAGTTNNSVGNFEKGKGRKGLSSRNRRRRDAEGLPGAHHESTSTTTRHHGRGLGKNSNANKKNRTTIASASAATTTTTTITTVHRHHGRGLGKNSWNANNNNRTTINAADNNADATADTTTNDTNFREKDSKRRQVMSLKNGSPVSPPNPRRDEDVSVGSASSNANDDCDQDGAQSPETNSSQITESRDSTNIVDTAHDSDGVATNPDAVASSPRVANLVVANPVTERDEEANNNNRLPQAEYVDLGQQRQQLAEKECLRRRFLCRWIGISSLGLSILLIVVLVLSLNHNQQPQQQNNSTGATANATSTISWNVAFFNELPDYTRQSILGWEYNPQSKAYEWLKNDPNIATYTMERRIQRFSLATIYYSTDGDNWKNNDRWLSFDHHECDWEFTNSVFFEIPTLTMGLATKSPCSSPDSNDNDDDHDVSVYTDLRLSRNELNGNIPKEMELLTSLKSIDISFNDGLVGTLPHKAFEQLSNLETFVAVSNQHTGQIPPFLFQQTSMSALVMYDNNFSGFIPSSVGGLSSLKLLALGDNSLTGSLPSEVGLAINLVTLNVERNGMGGTIPTEMGLLSTNLAELYLRGNKKIKGEIPTKLGQLAAVKTVSLGECGLAGALPSQLGQLGEVVKLYLQNNTSIPSHLGQMTAMRRLKLQDNNLSGRIPSELASLRTPHYALDYLNIRGNDLISGVIPNGLCRVDGEFNGQYDCSALLCGCECLCE